MNKTLEMVPLVPLKVKLSQQYERRFPVTRMAV